MRGYVRLAALLLLAGCAVTPKDLGPPVSVESAPEPVTVDEPSLILVQDNCSPGDDDGIGGTGCNPD
jgi:hypothetical protein